MFESTWGINSGLQSTCVIKFYSRAGDPEYPSCVQKLDLKTQPVGNDITPREEQDYSKLRVGSARQPVCTMEEVIILLSGKTCSPKKFPYPLNYSLWAHYTFYLFVLYLFIFQDFLLLLFSCLFSEKRM